MRNKESGIKASCLLLSRHEHVTVDHDAERARVSVRGTAAAAHEILQASSESSVATRRDKLPECEMDDMTRASMLMPAPAS